MGHWWIGKDLEGTCRRLIEVIPRHLLGRPCRTSFGASGVLSLLSVKSWRLSEPFYGRIFTEGLCPTYWDEMKNIWTSSVMNSRKMDHNKLHNIPSSFDSIVSERIRQSFEQFMNHEGGKCEASWSQSTTPSKCIGRVDKPRQRNPAFRLRSLPNPLEWSLRGPKMSVMQKK
jgi:hypothetical protein